MNTENPFIMHHPRAHVGLRLVAPQVDGALDSDPKTFKCFSLAGLMDVKDGPVLRPAALTAFLQGMMPSEFLQMRLYFGGRHETSPMREFHLMRRPVAAPSESEAVLESALRSFFRVLPCVPSAARKSALCRLGSSS